MAEPQGPLTSPELDEEIGRLAEEFPEPEPGWASQLRAELDAQDRQMRERYDRAAWPLANLARAYGLDPDPGQLAAAMDGQYVREPQAREMGE
jgi:hypothetical protein